jgi:TonB family protein
MPQTITTVYGAFELKRLYQINMLLGTGTACCVAILLISFIWLFNLGVAEKTETEKMIIGPTLIPIKLDRWIPPPKPDLRIPRHKGSGKKPIKPGFLIGDEFDEEETFIFVDTLPMTYGQNGFIDGDNDGVEGDGPFGDYQGYYIPPPDSFVGVEILPVQIFEALPEYPELARLAGFNAHVLIEAFVDREGIVRLVRAVKCSRPGLGFEEEAEKAAYKCRYRPAIQNGHPIGVWIGYRVKFVLE